MKIIRYSNINAFLDENLEFLEQEEAANNLLIGIPRSILSGQAFYDEINLYSIKDEQGDVLFSLVQTPPHNFLIYAADLISDQSLLALIKELADANIQTSGIIGPEELSISFAKLWQVQKGHSWRINFRQLAYQLDNLKEVSPAKGKLRTATPEDFDLIFKWMIDFEIEAMGNLNATGNEKAIRYKLKHGKFFLWEDEVPVCMAGITRPTRHGITINYVYTPKAFRGKGYASNCVHDLSQLMLKDFQFCSLFTDRDNPTSNKIYQQMGYYPVSKSLEIKFDRP